MDSNSYPPFLADLSCVREITLLSHSIDTCGIVYRFFTVVSEGFPGSSDDKVSAYNVGDLGLIAGSGRSPGEGNGNPLQYSCLENFVDGGV